MKIKRLAIQAKKRRIKEQKKQDKKRPGLSVQEIVNEIHAKGRKYEENLKQ
jgi:hypothetical protein